jgi:cytochrome c553
MAPIARRLSEQQIIALAAYFESLTAEGPATP